MKRLILCALSLITIATPIAARAATKTGMSGQKTLAAHAPATLKKAPKTRAVKTSSVGWTTEERESKAIAEVKRVMGPDAVRLSLFADPISFGGNPRQHPITGAGPITIIAKKTAPAGASWWKRMATRFSGANKVFQVNIGAQGEAQVIEYKRSAPQFKVAAAIGKALPFVRIVKDVYNSTQAKTVGISTGLATAGGLSLAKGLVLVKGAALASIEPMALVGLASYAILAVRKAVKEQDEQRSLAFNAAVRWIKSEQRANLQYPTLQDAYRQYQASLADIHTRGDSISSFAAKLNLKNL